MIEPLVTPGGMGLGTKPQQNFVYPPPWTDWSIITLSIPQFWISIVFAVKICKQRLQTASASGGRCPGWTLVEDFHPLPTPWSTAPLQWKFLAPPLDRTTSCVDLLTAEFCVQKRTLIVATVPVLYIVVRTVRMPKYEANRHADCRLSNAMHGIGQIENHLGVCLSVSVCPKYLSSTIWNVGYTCDNEDKVRRSIKPEVVNAHARNFTPGFSLLCSKCP